MKSIDYCQLYAFVDTAYLGERDPLEVAKMLCDGGADVVQVRAKGSSPEEVARLTERIKPVLDKAGVLLVVNDWYEIAVRMEADFCHMGQEDFFDGGIRSKAELAERFIGRYGRDQLERVGLGLSSHSPEQALRAVAAGADYVAVGPVFATPTKPGRTPVGLELLKWASDTLKVPWFAIGGINLDNIEKVLEAGARRICVVSAILLAPDVTRACLEFKRRLERVKLDQ